jgi:hypothetical protein
MLDQLETQLKIRTAQAMADLWTLNARFDHLPRTLRDVLPAAVREMDVVRLEDRRAAHRTPLNGVPSHRIADLLGAWDGRVADAGHPFPKPAATIYKMLDWLWPGTILDGVASAMIARETAWVDARPWCAETVPLARLLVGVERWCALRRTGETIPGLDLVADLFLAQSLMHSVGGRLPWSLARAIEDLDTAAAAEAGQPPHQETGPHALLAALTKEATRTLTTLTSPDMPERLTKAMRTGLPPDIPESLIVDLVAGAVLPRGAVFDRLGKSLRQGGREIQMMFAAGWLSSDSPKGAVRLAIPVGVMARILDPLTSRPPSAGGK